jgi:AcrR family transcriptional regulator
MSPRPRLSREETDEHARQLVEAAFRVAAATGEPEPPVHSILAEAGLSRQVFYRCFQSKENFMLAVLAEGRRVFAEYLMVRMAKASTPEEKVRAWVTGVMRQAESRAERTRPFTVSLPGVVSRSDYLTDTVRLLSRMLEDAIAAGVAEGAWRSDDPGIDALIIHDFVIASQRRHLLRNERPSQETIRRLVEFALRGLRVDPRSAAVDRVPVA